MNPPLPGPAAPLVPRASWDPAILSGHPALASLRGVCRRLAGLRDFPTTDELSALLAGVVTAGGAPLACERQTKKPKVRALADAYDVRIYREGKLPTRERSFHDLFNALVWATFPRAKRAVNARQYQALEDAFARHGGPPPVRTKEQDLLAMLDEGGLLLLVRADDAPGLDAALAAGDHAAVHALVGAGRLRALLFGHALAEHLVSSDAPVRGLPVRLVVPSLAPEAAVPLADEALARRLGDDFARDPATASLLALPLDAALF